MSIFRGKFGTFIEISIKIIGILAVVPVFAIIGYIIYKGIPNISWEFLTSMPHRGMREGGIFPAIIGTIYLTIGTIIVAVPLGVFTGVYLVEYAKDNFLTRIINLVILNLAGIPSIIYGLFGLSLFVIFFKFGASILSGSLTLGIMCLPVIITTTREALLNIPNNLREASLALGATKWETISKITLPSAFPGILTGVILSISRASGETAPILFTVAAFYLPFLPHSIMEQVMALPYHLYVISTQVPNMPKGNIYGTLLILLTITISFNLFGNFIRYRFKNKK